MGARGLAQALAVSLLAAAAVHAQDVPPRVGLGLSAGATVMTASQARRINASPFQFQATIPESAPVVSQVGVEATIYESPGARSRGYSLHAYMSGIERQALLPGVDALVVQRWASGVQAGAGATVTAFDIGLLVSVGRERRAMPLWTPATLVAAATTSGPRLTLRVGALGTGLQW